MDVLYLHSDLNPHGDTGPRHPISVQQVYPSQCWRLWNNQLGSPFTADLFLTQAAAEAFRISIRERQRAQEAFGAGG